MPRYVLLPAWWRLTFQTLVLMKREMKRIFPMLIVLTAAGWLITGVYINEGLSSYKAVLSTFSDSLLSGFEQVVVTVSTAVQGQFNGEAVSEQRIGAQILFNLAILLFWLAFIWIARHAIAKKMTTAREALYTSGTPLIPSFLLMLLLFLQAVPLLVAIIIFTSFNDQAFAERAADVALLATLGVLLVTLTAYFVPSTFIALQVSAIPGMYPMRSLRNARRIVAGRRLSVLFKIVMLILFSALIWALVLIPAILLENRFCGSENSCWSTYTILPGLYFFLTSLTVAFASIYIYLLYRALLDTSDVQQEG